MGAVAWRPLVRGDLRTFDRQAADLIMRAMELGGTGRISSKGHAILRAPNGQTLSVGRKMNSLNRASQNTLAAFNRAFGPFDDEEATTPRSLKSVPTPNYASEAPQGDPPDPTLECPAEECDAVFVTEGARYTHVNDRHERCTEPGCDFIAKSKAGRLAHERSVHQGAAPRRGTGKTQRMQAALEAIAAAIPTDYLPASTREAELEKELAEARARIGELEAKIALIKEGLGL